MAAEVATVVVIAAVARQQMPSEMALANPYATEAVVMSHQVVALDTPEATVVDIHLAL